MKTSVSVSVLVVTCLMTIAMPSFGAKPIGMVPSVAYNEIMADLANYYFTDCVTDALIAEDGLVTRIECQYVGPKVGPYGPTNSFDVLMYTGYNGGELNGLINDWNQRYQCSIRVDGSAMLVKGLVCTLVQ